MSKFIDKLGKTALQLPTPLGFGAAARRGEQAPAIMLVGQATSRELTKEPALAEARVDAILVSPSSWKDNTLDRIKNALGDLLWGVRLEDGVSEAQLGASKDRGCDFVVFDAGSAPASLLSDDDLGKLIAVDGGLEEHAARAIRGLTIDGAVYSPEAEVLPLTVRRLIEIQKVHGLIGNPFVMAAPAELAPAELEALRNAGITALLVGLSELDAIARTKEAIDRLPRNRPKSKSGGGIMPLVPSSVAPPSSDREEEDDEDF